MITDQCPLCKKKLKLHGNSAICIRGHYSLRISNGYGTEVWNYDHVYLMYVHQNANTTVGNYTRITYSGKTWNVSYRIPPTKKILKIIALL